MSAKAPLETGKLYVVATPIGNLGDMVPRAVEILQTVDVVAAEDTRHSAKLLSYFQIHTPMLAYHDHSDAAKVQAIIARLLAGEQVALISDAGTPLISDPGYRLVRLARERGIPVTPIPGACAGIAALSASGLPSDRFCFAGFLPAKSVARRKALAATLEDPATHIYYESPHRILATVLDIEAVFGSERDVVIAREISKAFETFLVGTIAEVRAAMEQDGNQQKGEFVVLIKGSEPPPADADLSREVQSLVSALLQENLPLKQVAAIASRVSGVKKNRLYEWALTQR